jgi:hypothetical protein
MNPWIQTRHGGIFDFGSLSGITAEDIASALGGICRYNGHTNLHYSVAEHSWLITDWFETGRLDREERNILFGRNRSPDLIRRIQLAGLLHDTHEAYTADLTQPLQRAMSPAWRAEWKALQHQVEQAICVALGVPIDPGLLDHPAVKYADLHILLDEQAALLGPQAQPWEVPPPPLGVTIRAWDRDEAAERWLAAFRRLTS